MGILILINIPHGRVNEVRAHTEGCHHSFFSSLIYFKRLFKKEQFYIYNEKWERYRDFPYTPSHLPSFPMISITHQSATFVIKNELHWHNDHSKSIVHLKVHSWCCTNKCMMTYIYNYNIRQIIFTALKILCILPIHHTPLFLPSSNHWSFHCLHNFPLSRISYSWIQTVHSLSDWLISLKVPPCLFMAW